MQSGYQESVRQTGVYGKISFAVAAGLLVWGVTSAAAQAPLVKPNSTVAVADGVHVIPDQRVNLVPNIGIIEGRDGLLVVDTGMGPQNARVVLEEVRKISDKKILYLTFTHFHPEHGMGAQSFPAETTIIYPGAQAEELAEKGQPIIQMFSGFSPDIAALLKEVKIVAPDVTYGQEAELNLGNFTVRLLHFGAAHTRGDNFVFLPKQKVLFAGDIVVNRFFPIMPDGDASGSNWIEVLEKLEKLGAKKVVPGHGAVGDATLITKMKDYLVGLRARVRQLAEEGKSLEEIEKVIVPAITEKYKDWDNPNWITNAVQNFYGELAR